MNEPTKLFTATIQDTSLEKAIDLPGWSHASQPFRKRVLWYPWEADFRTIYFRAKNRREACKQLDHLNLLVRDLSEGT